MVVSVGWPMPSAWSVIAFRVEKPKSKMDSKVVPLIGNAFPVADASHSKKKSRSRPKVREDPRRSSRRYTDRQTTIYPNEFAWDRSSNRKTGLKVSARWNKKRYPTKEKVTKEEKASLNIKKHEVIPLWNYTVYPDKK
jgi:hypothetical protein